MHKLFAQGGTDQGGSGFVFMIGLMILFGVFFFIMSRGQSKEKKKRRVLLDNMKKNDRVMTIGGIVGTVVVVRDSEVVLKVDESTNTKMTFTKRAIQQILGESGTEALGPS